MDISNQKTHSKEEASIIIADWKANNQKIVFTNGCFDILHPGHIDYLTKAKALGNKLIIGLNSDNSISRLKGPSRPINNDFYRKTMLSALSCVDLVVIFEEDTPLDLIKYFEPNTLVKGGDYNLLGIVGADEVIKNGGNVEIIPFLEGFSSTNVITKIQNLSIT